jgi:N-acetylglucosaminyl-diphospho-decaprenol L-rhamnosyltransferase
MRTDAGAARQPRLLRSALLVAVFSALGLALTVTWQLAIARLFGASPALDAFWIGLALPKAISESFHFGLLTLLFVLVAAREEEDPGALTSAVLNLTFLFTWAAVTVLVSAARPIVAAMAPGLAPADQARAVFFLRALAPVLGVTAVAGALGGLAVSRKRLLAFSASRAILPAAQTVVLLLLWRTSGVAGLVAAIWAGAIASVLVYGRGVRRLWSEYRPTLAFHGRTARTVLQLQATLALVWLLVNANQIAARHFASLLGPGQISALEFAWRFEIPIAQVVGFAVALPTFALLAASAGADQRDEFRRVLGTSTRLLMIGVVPMIGFMVVLREPLSRVWFQGGAFSAEAASSVASLLPWLAIVYLCRAFSSILVFGLLIVRRTRLLLAWMVVETALNAGLGGLLSRRFGLPGIAMIEQRHVVGRSAAADRRDPAARRRAARPRRARRRGRGVPGAGRLPPDAARGVAHRPRRRRAVSGDGAGNRLRPGLRDPVRRIRCRPHRRERRPPPARSHAAGVGPIMTRTTPEISVVVANYNASPRLEMCLRALRGHACRRGVEVIVVDDGSSDGSAAMVRRKFPEMQVMANPRNCGYARSCNLAIRVARGRFIHLLNNDVELQPGALDALADFLDGNAAAGTAGSLLLNDDGSVQISAKALPTLRSAFFGGRSWFSRWLPGNRFSRQELQHWRAEEGAPFTAGYVSGASLMVTRAALDAIGELDERLFYFNDADFCQRIWQSGHAVYCVPAARSMHLNHQGGSRRTLRRRLWALGAFHYGAYVYARKHYTGGAWTPAHACVVLGLAGRLVVTGVMQLCKEVVGIDRRAYGK